MKQWSKIKKELEQQWLAPCLRGHVDYSLTKYRKSHDHAYGRVTIRIDKQDILNCSDLVCIRLAGWESTNQALADGILHTYAFYLAYREYANQPLEASMISKNALVRLFAIVDRRLGKQRRQNTKPQLIQDASWLEPFFHFRNGQETITNSTIAGTQNR